LETYRQGDVLLIKLDNNSIILGSKPVARDEKNRIVLALGEATGHAHVIEEPTAEMIRNVGTGVQYVNAPEGATVTHEEHAEVKLPAGIYEVRMQREAGPAEDRAFIQRQTFD
jgi:hypothetical protein